MNSLPPPPARGEGRGPAGPHRGPPAGGRKFDQSLVYFIYIETSLFIKLRLLINFIVFHPIGPPYLGRKRKVIYRKIYIVLFISFISLIVKALYGSIATVILAVVFTCFHSTELTIFFILAVTGLIKYTLLSSCYYIFSAVYTYIPYSAPRSTLKSFNVHSHSSVTMINKRFYTTDVKDSTLPPN